MEQLFVVWYSKGKGWTPSTLTTKTQAERFALSLQDRGYRIRIVPQQHTSMDDIVNG